MLLANQLKSLSEELVPKESDLLELLKELLLLIVFPRVAEILSSSSLEIVSISMIAYFLRQSKGLDASRE